MVSTAYISTEETSTFHVNKQESSPNVIIPVPPCDTPSYINIKLPHEECVYVDMRAGDATLGHTYVNIEWVRRKIPQPVFTIHPTTPELG